MIRLIFLSFFLLFSCSEEKVQPKVEAPKAKKRVVKVAAVQCYSQMGKIKDNRELLTRLIKEAAGKGAKIIVLPEAAISGYMDPQGMKGDEIVWTKEEPGEYQMSVKEVAEKADGESAKYFSTLAKDLKVYLTMPFIEVADDNFYNSMLLMDPEGKVIAHHRKKALWNHGDGSWCSKGDLEPQVVETPYGKVGLMICYDHHVMPPLLEEKGADIVLYSVGCNGPSDNWFKVHFPEKAAKHKFSAIVANWSHAASDPYWNGTGLSNIVFRNGIVIKMTGKYSGNAVVLADLPY